MKLLIVPIFFLIVNSAFAQFTPLTIDAVHHQGAAKDISLIKKFPLAGGYKFDFLPVHHGSFWYSGHPSVYLGHKDHLPGFFCKMEYKLESCSKLAPRFRLGSLNYTEWMEGKGEWYNRYK